MLRALILFSVRRRGVVAALASMLVAYGLWGASHAKLDVLPEFAPPQVVIQSEAPGLAPEQVEMLSQPIESAVGGLAGLETLRSESIQGLSVVTAVFRADVDVLAARQLLAQQVGEASPRLPLGVGPPQLSPLTSATMDVLKIGLETARRWSCARSPMDAAAPSDRARGRARNVFGDDVRRLRSVHPRR
jgi:Cu/Ag efflux pump CusA